MKIIIVGGGKVGRSIARRLVNEKHRVVIVEKDPDVAEDISEQMDALTVCGNGVSFDTLKRAGAESADLLIACTPMDEQNILSAIFAKKLGCGSMIARVRDPEYAEQIYHIQEELGLSMVINPEMIAAREVFRQMELPGMLKRDTFAKGLVEIVELVPSPGDILDGLQLSSLQAALGCHALVVAVVRGRDVYIPGGSFTLKAEDKAYLCAPAADIVRILKKIEMRRQKAENVLIVGGGRTGAYLTQMLLYAGATVKIIERDKKRADELSVRFHDATVFCADGTVGTTLEEVSAGSAGAAATLLDINEENLILSMRLRRLGVPVVVTKLDRAELGEFFKEQGLERTVNPEMLSANAIVRYVQAMKNSAEGPMLSLHRIAGGMVNAMEFYAAEKTHHIGKRLMELKLKPNILIACIVRIGKIIIPGGNDSIEMGDTVVIVSHSGNKISDLNDIFR